MSIAKRAQEVAASLTLAITAKAKKMNEEGVSVVSFGAGEPDFNTPDYIIEAAKSALDKGYTKYTPSGGILPLKKAICDKLKKDNNLEYTPKQIVVSNGAKHSLFNVMQALIDEGDEVIIPSPFWLTYPELVKLSQGVPKFIEGAESNGFKITAKQLKNAITKRTKAIVLNSPNNPTGAVYSLEELTALAEVIEKAGIYVISDEIYEKLVYGVKHYSILNANPNLYSKTIVVNGVSKSYSMTGWRIGYIAAPAEIAAAIDNMQSHTTSNANSIAQYATLAALTGGEDFMEYMVKTFNSRRRFMVERIASIPMVSCAEPKGAFYVLMNISKLIGKKIDGHEIKSAQVCAELMLDKAFVAVVPGEAFGAGDFIRLSYAISMEDIRKGLDAIEQFIKNLT